MTTTLITGGNRSLGYEIARRLIEAGQLFAQQCGLNPSSYRNQYKL